MNILEKKEKYLLFLSQHIDNMQINKTAWSHRQSHHFGSKMTEHVTSPGHFL